MKLYALTLVALLAAVSFAQAEDTPPAGTAKIEVTDEANMPEGTAKIEVTEDAPASN